MADNEQNIKRGFNIYWYYWTLVALAGFILINYFLRDIKIEGLDLGLMISVVSFLFGFLVTITFSMILSKMLSLKDSLSNETGRLTSLYLLSKNLGNDFHKKITERIDKYTIDTLRDYTKYETGRDSIYGMYDDVKHMEIKNNVQQTNADSFMYILGEFQPVREKLEYLTGNRLEWSLKLSTYLLGGILVILLFLNRGDLFTNLIFIILSTIIIFIFLIIEDYDDLRIGDYDINISNSEQIFDLIGRDRYYPQSVLSRAKLIKGKSYRIGFYDSVLKQEQTFNITYGPSFGLKIGKLLKKVKRDGE